MLRPCLVRCPRMWCHPRLARPCSRASVRTRTSARPCAAAVHTGNRTESSVRPLLSATVSPCRARVSDIAADHACAQSPQSPLPYRISQSIRLSLFRSKRSLLHVEALRSTGVAPLPRYYGLIRLLLSLSLFAVLPSSLAELSKHAATFAPPRPLTPKSSRCGGVGFTHTETLTTRK